MIHVTKVVIGLWALASLRVVHSLMSLVWYRSHGCLQEGAEFEKVVFVIVAAK